MKRTVVSIVLVFAALLVARAANGQVGTFSKEDRIKYTPQWKGERFPDGRPKVPDELLTRMKTVSIEEAWAVLRRHGFNNQFEGGWTLTHQDPVVVGRAVTAAFQPARPDVNEVIQAQGKKDSRIGAKLLGHRHRGQRGRDRGGPDGQSRRWHVHGR